MVVKTNPIKLIYRLDRDNWHEFNEAGLSLVARFGGVSVVYSDSNYAYVTFKSPYKSLDSNDFRWSNFGSWSGGGIKYDLTLHPDTPKTPALPVSYTHLTLPTSDLV